MAAVKEPFSDRWVCDKCLEKVNPETQGFCPECGKAINKLCTKCKKPIRLIDGELPKFCTECGTKVKN